MGRPLNKKYFGNRNTGSASVTTDDGIGGSSVASVTLNALGSYTTRPTITFATTPKLPGGVRATGTITSEVLSATISGGTGYGNAQTFNLTVANAAGNTAILNVTSDAGGAVVTVNSITARGTFETLGPVVAVSGGTGTNAEAVLTFRAKAVVITEPGSGYTAAPAPTFTQSVTATSVNMLVDSGNVGTVGNQENAIIIRAKTTSGGTALVGDIQKQSAAHRYKVETANGVEVCKLIASDTLAYKEARIVATDDNGSTYWVTKLTTHKATLVQRTMVGSYRFDSGLQIKWSLAAPTSTTVQIENA